MRFIAPLAILSVSVAGSSASSASGASEAAQGTGSRSHTDNESARVQAEEARARDSRIKGTGEDRAHAEAAAATEASKRRADDDERRVQGALALVNNHRELVPYGRILPPNRERQAGAEKLQARALPNRISSPADGPRPAQSAEDARIQRDATEELVVSVNGLDRWGSLTLLDLWVVAEAAAEQQRVAADKERVAAEQAAVEKAAQRVKMGVAALGTVALATGAVYGYKNIRAGDKKCRDQAEEERSYWCKFVVGANNLGRSVTKFFSRG